MQGGMLRAVHILRGVDAERQHEETQGEHAVMHTEDDGGVLRGDDAGAVEVLQEGLSNTCSDKTKRQRW